MMVSSPNIGGEVIFIIRFISIPIMLRKKLPGEVEHYLSSKLCSLCQAIPCRSSIFIEGPVSERLKVRGWLAFGKGRLKVDL
jgi:branched-subunit amino acid transport protein